MNAIFYSFSFSFAFFNFEPVILKSFFYTVFKYNSIKQPLISYSVEHNWVRWHALRTQCAVSRSHELSSRPRLSDKIHVWFFLSLIHSVVLNNVFHFQHQYFIFFFYSFVMWLCPMFTQSPRCQHYEPSPKWMRKTERIPTRFTLKLLLFHFAK